MSRTSSRPATRSLEGGFTLIELVVTVALFTIVMGAVYSLLAVARNDAFTSKERVEMIQNIRVAMEAIGRDAINAGVGFPRDGAAIPDNKLSAWGLGNDADTEFDRVTPVLPGNDLNANTLNPTPNTKTDQVTFIFQDGQFNGGGPVDVASISAGKQLRLDPAFSASDLCAPGDVYIVWGSTPALVTATAVPGGINNAVNCYNGDPIGLNYEGSNGPLGKLGTGATTLYKATVVTYLVTTDGTLMRRVWGSPTALAGEGTTPPSTTLGYLDEPLAFNVEDFQVQYILAPDAITTINPDADQRANIRQIQVTITTRSPEIDGRFRQPFRTTLTSTFSTRNLVYSKQLAEDE